MKRIIWTVLGRADVSDPNGHVVVGGIEIGDLIHVFVSCPARDRIAELGVDIQVRLPSGEPLAYRDFHEPGDRQRALATLTVTAPSAGTKDLFIVVRDEGQVVDQAQLSPLPIGWFAYGDKQIFNPPRDGVGLTGAPAATITIEASEAGQALPTPPDEAPRNSDNPRFLARLAFAKALRDIWTMQPHEVVDIVLGADDDDAAIARLMDAYEIDERTAKGILDCGLRQLTRRSRASQDMVIESMSSNL